MKYSVILAGAFVSAVWAIPQATQTSVSLSPQATCLAKCPVTDLNCQALCVGSAHPNEEQVNKTTQCAEKCDQGDGSPEDTQKYSDCVQKCIANNFPTTSTIGGGAQASNAPSGSASGSDGASQASPTATGAGASGSPSASNSAASASSTGAASANTVQMGAAGIAGLLAIFAL